MLLAGVKPSRAAESEPTRSHAPRIDLPREPEQGFTAANTSGLSSVELASLNGALRRLMTAGLTEHEAKRALDAAVRDCLEPGDAEEAEIERLLAWR